MTVKKRRQVALTYSKLSKRARKDYAVLDRESKSYPLERTDDGVLRFRSNRAILFLLAHPDKSLNDLWMAASREHWPVRDVMVLYRMMGYSLSGFLDVFLGSGNLGREYFERGK